MSFPLNIKLYPATTCELLLSVKVITFVELLKDITGVNNLDIVLVSDNFEFKMSSPFPIDCTAKFIEPDGNEKLYSVLAAEDTSVPSL